MLRLLLFISMVVCGWEEVAFRNLFSVLEINRWKEILEIVFFFNLIKNILWFCVTQDNADYKLKGWIRTRLARI